MLGATATKEATLMEKDAFESLERSTKALASRRAAGWKMLLLGMVTGFGTAWGMSSLPGLGLFPKPTPAATVKRPSAPNIVAPTPAEPSFPHHPITPKGASAKATAPLVTSPAESTGVAASSVTVAALHKAGTVAAPAQSQRLTANADQALIAKLKRHAAAEEVLAAADQARIRVLLARLGAARKATVQLSALQATAATLRQEIRVEQRNNQILMERLAATRAAPGKPEDSRHE